MRSRTVKEPPPTTQVLRGHVAATEELPRLPLVVPIGSGESFISWIDRLAGLWRVGRRDVWRALGLMNEDGKPPRAIGAQLAPAQVAAIARVSGEPSDAIAASLLTHFDGTALTFGKLDLEDPSSARLWAATQWVHVSGSRACPACLTDNGHQWQLTWKLSWFVLCPTHGNYLVSHCPRCGSRLQPLAGDARQRYVCVGTNRDVTQGDPRPRDSTYRRAADVCRHPVAYMPVRTVSDEQMAAIHKTLLAVIEPGSAHDALGDDELWRGRGRLDVVQDVRAAVRLVLHQGSVQLLADADTGVVDAFAQHCQARDAALAERANGGASSYIGYRAAPQTPELMAAALRIAVPMVWGTDAQVQDSVASFVDAANHLPGGTSRWARIRLTWRPPPIMDGPLRHAREDRQFGGAGPLSSRANVHRSKAARVTEDPAAYVPSLCWPNVYAPLAPIVSARRPESGQRLLSICLVRLLGPGLISYEEAATSLALPPGVASECHQLLAKMRRAHTAGAVTRALEELADALSAHAPAINYSLRRRALAALTDITDSEWRSFCANVHWNATSKKVCLRRPVVTALTWVQLTGGDWHFAPALTSGIEPINRLAAKRYRRTPQSTRVLVSAERDLAELVHHRLALTGPLAWEPTTTADQSTAVP